MHEAILLDMYGVIVKQTEKMDSFLLEEEDVKLKLDEFTNRH